MIDCLSNPDWLAPQIDCLLFLQNIRIEQPLIFDKFFLSITIFGEFWLPTLVCAIVYWCIDFRAGIYLFSLESFNIFLAHFFKMLACVYRPWVLDSRIHPSELAVPFAKGYSFPSGHSAMSSSTLGGVAFLTRRNKILPIFLVLLILMIGFSRLWLGVHTPQDVVCGLTMGLILVFAVNPIINWAEKDDKRYMYMLGIINILVILALVCVYFFNTYRVDYVAGEILIDPQKLKYVTVVVYGFSLGLINGCYLCRRYCPFDPKTVSVKNRIVRGIVGGISLILLLKFTLGYIVFNMVPLKFGVAAMFMCGIFVTLIYPLMFSKIKSL